MMVLALDLHPKSRLCPMAAIVGQIAREVLFMSDHHTGPAEGALLPTSKRWFPESFRRRRRILASRGVALLAIGLVSGLATGCSSATGPAGANSSVSTSPSGGGDVPPSAGSVQTALSGQVVQFGKTAELLPKVFVKIGNVEEFKAADPPSGCHSNDHFFRYSVTLENRKAASFGTASISLLPVDPTTGETRKDSVYGSDNGIPMDRVPWWSPVANGDLIRPGATSKFLFGACTDLDLDQLVIKVEYPSGNSMSEWAKVYFRK